MTLALLIEFNYVDKLNRYILKLASVLLGLMMILSTCLSSFAIAQTDSTADQESIFSMGVGVQHGFIFPHSVDVQNTSGARPTGIESILSWQRTDSTIFALCHCNPRQGLLLSYYDYDVDLLGKGVAAAYFLEPTYRISKSMLFSLKGAAGLSYLSNPYDSISNPTNQSYSTYLSVYLLVGVGVWLKLSDNWWVNPSVNYQHISNGGMRQPNKGINWPTAGIALSYQPNPRSFYTGVRTTEKFWKNYSTRYDFTLLGTMNRGYNAAGIRKRFFGGGFAFQAGKQVGRLNMLTVGTEVYFDGKLQDKLDRDRVNASAIKSGLLFGHEFLLGKFQFSQRLGVYIFDQTPYYDRIFHRWGINSQLNRHFSTGINLLAHRHVAEFFDFRLTYTFQRRYQR